MRVIYIKSLNAYMYADDLSEVIDGKIRFYDSEKRYFDYWEYESLVNQSEIYNTTIEQEYEKWIKLFENAPSVDYIVECFSIYGYTTATSDNLDSILEDFAETYDANEELSNMSLDGQKRWLRENEWICVIGDYWVHLFD